MIKGTGSIKISGSPAPPEAPKINISLTSLAGVRQKPVVDLTGTMAFRTPKFATLFGRYSVCGREAANPEDKETRAKYLIDNSSVECRDKRSFLNRLITGGNAFDPTKRTPFGYFAGFDPSISFDIGFNSTKSKNSITATFPFVYYINISSRTTIEDEISTTLPKYADKSPTPLYSFGGWANTPFWSIADVKISFGPKIEFYNRYHPRNLLATIRADFEFHRWLGTIAGRRKLLAGDFKESDRLPPVNFGWKFVPYVEYDGGKHLTSESVKQKISGVQQQVTIPKFNINRVMGGGAGTFEWLVFDRYVGLSVDYSLAYLASDEKNSYATDTLLLLRNIRGFQPVFKTTFEFSFDPERRYSFKTTYENGRALPDLGNLNKVTTGITLTY
jgi:hypothetical protein